MSLAMLNLFSRALDCSSNGVVISDMTLPGQPVFCANPAFTRITGFEPDEAIGRNCAFLQRDDTARAELGELRRAIAAGAAAQVVLRNYRRTARCSSTNGPSRRWPVPRAASATTSAS